MKMIMKKMRMTTRKMRMTTRKMKRKRPSSMLMKKKQTMMKL